VTSIGAGALSFCINLQNIAIPNSVIKIGDNAFYNCTNLKNITIPSGVTSIGKQAFIQCSNLQSVYCKPINPPLLAELAFYSNASGRKIYVPTASVDAYKAAEGWKRYADNITGYEF
jgi:hypothetical protein